MAADLSYDVQVNSAQAERNLANLQKSVGTLNATFVRFRETLATISLGAVIASSVRYADAIQDISDSTGLAIANIVGFSAAVQDNGGSAESAQKAILKFVGAIGEAAAGSSDLQSAFRDVNVSLNDLATLSEQDLLNKTIVGLDKITNASERSILVTKLLGKEFRNVRFGELGAAYAAATAQNARFSGAISNASAAQGQLEVVIRNFQLALLEVLSPISKFISEINISADAIKQFITTVLQIGVALFALTKGLTIINRLANAWGTLGTSAASAGVGLTKTINGIGAGFFGFFKNLGRAVGLLPTAFGGITSLGFALASLSRSLIRFAGLAGLIYAVVEAFSYLEKSVFQTNYIEKGVSGIAIGLEHLTRAAGNLLNLPTNLIGKILGIDNAVGLGTPLVALANKAEEARKAAEDARTGARGRGDPAEIANREAAAEAAKKEKERLREVTDATAKLLAKQSAAYKLINAEQGRFTQGLFDNLGFQRDSVGLTEDELEVRTAVREETLRYNDAIQALKDKQATLRAEMIGEKDADKVRVLGSEISLINKTLKQAEGLHQLNRQKIEEQIPVIQGLRMAEAARKQDIENTTKAIEDQLGRQQALGEILRQANQQVVDTTDRPSARQTVGLSSIQKQILDIQESARKAAIEAARSFAANFEDNGDGLTPERARELSAGLDQIAGAYKRVAGAQIEVAEANYETARSFSTGWEEAFAKYAEDAQDASKQAATYFERFTQGFEDAIVSLVTNGKFSFKDFANSIIADFARIQARQALTSFMSGATPGGSVLGSLFNFGKSLFGFSNGGLMAQGQPGVVGERGPELFIPSTAGRIIPNNQLNGGQSQVINNAITYEIQAVDAASFRQLVARDPNFIYAVTEQGRRNQPSRRSA